MKLILRVLVNALALGAAELLVDGIRAGGFRSLLLTALVFGVLNALVRPVLKLLSCPLLVLTLGLFTLVLNAGMLLLTAKVGRNMKGIWKLSTVAYVGDVEVASADMLVAPETNKRAAAPDAAGE